MKINIVLLILIMFSLALFSACFEKPIVSSASTAVISNNTQMPSETTMTEAESIQESQTDIEYGEIRFIDFENDDYVDKTFFGGSIYDKDYYIEDGLLIFDPSENDCYMCFPERIPAGSVFHIRLKTFLVRAEITKNPIITISSDSGINYACTNRRPFDMQYRSENGYAYIYYRGNEDLQNIGQWLDIAIYLDEDGVTYKSVIWETENNEKIIFAAVRMPDELKVEYDNFQIYVSHQITTKNYENPYSEYIYYSVDSSLYDESKIVQVDFIRVYRVESLQKYLEEYSPSYNANKETADGFLNNDVHDLDDYWLGKPRYSGD